MNKIRVRLLVNGNYEDYTIETKINSESGFEDFIKRKFDELGEKPIQYRFDLINKDGRATKSRFSFPILDARFF